MDRKSRKLSLQGILGRFLCAVTGSIAVLVIFWWTALLFLMNMGVLIKPSAAAASLKEVEQTILKSDRPLSEMVPHMYQWAVFDRQGKLLKSDMSERMQREAESVGSEGGIVRSFPYDRYYSALPYSDGTICILEYDYSIVYGSPLLQEKLPDFQSYALILLLALGICVIFMWTRHYSGILKNDAGRLLAAVSVIEEKRLDEDFSVGASVCELNEVLHAMHNLKDNLAESFSRQWMMEQGQREELAALSHDLKTPLTIIQGNADLLEEENLGEEQRLLVEGIQNSAEHIREYIGRLKEISLGQEEPAGPRIEEISLTKFMQDIVKAGNALCMTKGLLLKTYSVPKAVLLGKRNILYRAVLNLIDNAVRYTPEGGTIELRVMEEKGILSLLIRDSGPGFTEEALRKAGRIFYTTDASRPKEGHMGMGLKFVSEAAKSHGGELKLYNWERGGAAELFLGGQTPYACNPQK